ncbi:uncharacterized protein MEPE_06169 [Melanopsichium pennsylvanicum]|uniref:Uncharacterized protein n=2 Tax=Melanopsichium pennsylvanicum TaxID=63383 RepID=A0AAJ4XQR4_9BASI|nr:putative protein [Melanopsichium pennsylvanicum 4]SNX87459.1 uncharacterized protein MEPE_06169 [Melanopsichium pennsylvanicum]
MPLSATTESEQHIAAQRATAASSANLPSARPDQDEASDADTEPLPYDDDDDDNDNDNELADDRHSDYVMDSHQLSRHAAAFGDTDADAPGEEIIMAHGAEDVELDPSQAENTAHHDNDDQDEDEDEDEDDDAEAEPASQVSAAHDPNSNVSSPQKTGGFTGDEFSDESELTDEDEDQGEDEDASSLSDDDLGGSDDEDDEDEDEDDDDQEGKTHEDEAAEALAALTGGTDGAAQDSSSATAGGLDALAMLATAGGAEADRANEDDEDEEDDASDAEEGEVAAEAGAPLDDIAKPGRLQQLRQEADGDDLSSDITPEPEYGEIEGAAHADDASDHEDNAGSPRDTDLDLIASMKKRAAATGGATSLLEPEQIVDSLPGSAASSRAASPLGDEDEEKLKAAQEHDADNKKADVAAAEAEHFDTAAGTPAPDAADHEEDTSTDEAAVRRQEAMEALTKIEIGFAMLRDRLYVERLQEISKEGEMILDGTHPELLHLNKAIEVRRQRRTQLVEMWFEQQEQQYERVAKAEEFAAWSIWRSSCANLRRDMMDELGRKRRRLDREKRTLDAPRPARRHQIFETELVRNPDRLHIPLEHSVQQEAERGDPKEAKSCGRKQAAKRKALARDLEAREDDFVAYPDLKGLPESDIMMDIEQMGIRPVGMPLGMYDPFYGPQPHPEVGIEFQNPADVYAMYGPEAAAAAAAAQAAHMNGGGFPPYGLGPGASRGMAPPQPHGGMMMGPPGTPHRHGGDGMHGLPPPPPPPHMMEMGIMPFDPYAAAEMEHAARMHQARMGMGDRSSPFLQDMYAPPPPGYPHQQHFGPPSGPGPMAGGGGRGRPPSPTPPHRGSGRKERSIVDQESGVNSSGGRGRGTAKTSGGRGNKSRHTASSVADSPSQPSRAGKTNLPPPPSMAASGMPASGMPASGMPASGMPASGMPGVGDERDVKLVDNGAQARGGVRHQHQHQQGGGFAGSKSATLAGSKGLTVPPTATPVAAAIAAGVGNGRLYPPPNHQSTKSG